ncbi:ATP-dependent protease, partial [Mesorhizobium sp. M2D.F.Ca.ET.145.01.1.1]
GGRRTLNIFEPRSLQMVDEAVAGSRLIGIIQPGLNGALREDGEPELCNVGCIGRIIAFSETGDGRYLISLQGVCRFRIAHELTVKTPFRQCKPAPFLADLDEEQAADEID